MGLILPFFWVGFKEGAIAKLKWFIFMGLLMVAIGIVCVHSWVGAGIVGTGIAPVTLLIKMRRAC